MDPIQAQLLIAATGGASPRWVRCHPEDRARSLGSLLFGIELCLALVVGPAGVLYSHTLGHNPAWGCLVMPLYLPLAAWWNRRKGV